MTSNNIQPAEEDSPSLFPSALSVSPELRLVLLGLSGSGKSSAGNIILGKEEFLSLNNSRTAVTQECEIKAATVAGRQVSVVDTPDWFFSERPLEDVQDQISTCKLLSSPGPHAILLCVPVDRPVVTELQALEAIAHAFGDGAVESHTLVLFTHGDRLGTREAVEEHIVSRREDLLAVTERCGGRHHLLERGGEAGEGSVRELLEKIEDMVRKAGGTFFPWPPSQETKAQGEEEKTVRMRGGKKEELEAKTEEGDGEEEEWVKSSEKDEESGDEISPSAVASRDVSFIRFLWETLLGFLKSIPGLVRREALLGGLVGLFVGGPFGSVLGTTVGTVATEVGKRKNSKQK
ncbi:LOW QUALITY PROTEIN: GTPase IMAP family member 1-like [Brienomyrus brachyistius]|uniref:LOW QUALITY PROTEIN: GTPase IMAP family member 1-like n=1 Tax=Brienomyrus brachyistius TaxID=42636 RepID=UPI0020B26242|nr:LOW QUALITY PROTEIN: GTPase IMAP family member 1-like [Brienomyrus brachyistius]